MNFGAMSRIFTLILTMVLLAGCQNTNQTQNGVETVAVIYTASPASDSSLFLTQYVFPTSIDPAKRYLFYLHGKIIEDQGLPAVSPDYGGYEYESILEKLASQDFAVISEQRRKNTDGMKYAERVAGQVTELLKAGVPAKNIVVVGSSKGAAITIAISGFLANRELNFVLLGTCNSEAIQLSKGQNLYLYGNVLAIRDSVDDLSGSCQELFNFSEGKIARHEEIVPHVGTGHGILYKPLDEWILPTVQWADQQNLLAEKCHNVLIGITE